jgi:hypothetical protein
VSDRTTGRSAPGKGEIFRNPNLTTSLVVDLVDFGMGLQGAGDAPGMLHSGSIGVDLRTRVFTGASESCTDGRAAGS